MKHLRYKLLLLVLLATTVAWGMEPQEAVNRFAQASILRHASAGVAVMRLDSGTIVASNLLNQAITTASTMKTVTSSIALEQLGGDFKFETKVYLRGTVHDDTLEGDIVVVGGGDPTLGSRHFPANPSIINEIVQALQSQGIKCVNGRVVADESIYPYPPYSIHWDVGDLAWDYGAAVHALNYCDNEAHVSFSVDKWGRFSSFTTKPQLNSVEVINKMRFSKSNTDIDFALEYGRPTLVLMGPVGPGKHALTFSNPAPANLLIDNITQTLRRKGITVKEDDISFPAKPQRSLLITHYSPELTDIIQSLLARSDNMFTHALLRAVAVRDPMWRGVNLDQTGVSAVRRWLKSKGIDSDALFMRDGSGLARAGKASPLMFVQMLRYMRDRQYNGKRLCDLMPKAGTRIGSLLPSSGLSQNIVIKSGSMTDVQCFVGYYPANNPEYAFAVLVNNYDCQRKELKNHIDKLLINLFGKNN